MEGRADLTNTVALPVGPGAVGKEHHGQLAFEIHPKRGPRVAEMSGGMPAEEPAG